MNQGPFAYASASLNRALPRRGEIDLGAERGQEPLTDACGSEESRASLRTLREPRLWVGSTPISASYYALSGQEGQDMGFNPNPRATKHHRRLK